MSKYIKLSIAVVIVVLVLGWTLSIQFNSQRSVYSGLPNLQKPAPDFALKDDKGKVMKLSDFKGKVVYVKFWASWCGDCIKQVVPLREIEKNWAKNENIAFVYISVDDDMGDWQKSVVRNKLVGYELISIGGDESEINKNYGISEIPRYVLIGKDGLILDNNAPKPSDMPTTYFSNFLK